jgi:MFS transporter, PPP family, 3-phenylpropionic acid transporter
MVAPEHTSGADSANRLALQVATFFAALFFAYGVILPYFPVWLDARGLTPIEISIVTSAPLFLRILFTPTAGLVADRLGDHRRVIIALAWGGLALALFLSQLASFWPILAVGVLLLLAVGTMLPLNETVAVAAVRSAGLDYGRMRLWGSLTFIVANFAGGLLIEALGGSIGIWMIAAGVGCTVLAAHFLPIQPRSAPPPAKSAVPWRASLPVRLLRNPLFVLFLVATGGIHGAHATFYTFGALQWQAQGLPAAWVGTLWAIGVLAEVILFAYSAPVVARVSPVGLIALGGGISVLRWTAMAFDPPLALLVPLQALHAVTFGAAHLGGIVFITRAVPQTGMGSAQAFYAVVAGGVALGVVGLISGALYDTLGGATYLVAAAAALVGSVCAAALLRSWDGSLLCAEDDGASPTTPAREG